MLFLAGYAPREKTWEWVQVKDLVYGFFMDAWCIRFGTDYVKTVMPATPFGKSSYVWKQLRQSTSFKAKVRRPMGRFVYGKLDVL